MAFCRTNDSGMRRRSPAAAAFLLLLLLGCLLPAGAAEEIAVRKRILYIASADSSALWTEEVLDGFLDGIRRGNARRRSTSRSSGFCAIRSSPCGGRTVSIC